MRAEIYWIDGVTTGRLAVMARPRGGDWLEDEVRSLRGCGVDVLASLLTRAEQAELDLTDEARSCAANGIEFISIPIEDRAVPESTAEVLNLVLRLRSSLSRRKSVVIHCRQGIGRSGMMAALVLISLGETPEAAFERAASGRGCPVPDTPEQREWVVRFAERHLGTTLLLSTRSLPAAPILAEAAHKVGWSVHYWDDTRVRPPSGRVVYYGGSDLALEIAARCRLSLLEPPLDLLARLPASLLLRQIEFARFRDLSRLKRATFVKPADPLDRCFDAGIYSSVHDIRAPRGISAETLVLVAEPVEWLSEHRCFVLDGRVVASSPYLSFSRPVWRAWGHGGEKAVPSQDVLATCSRLLAIRSPELPPAFVADVGLIEGRGWAVVEFNPVWCSGLLGAEPAAVLGVLERACQEAGALSTADRAWVAERRTWAVECLAKSRP